jgi:hypothetical protein
MEKTATKFCHHRESASRRKNGINDAKNKHFNLKTEEGEEQRETGIDFWFSRLVGRELEVISEDCGDVSITSRKFE